MRCFFDGIRGLNLTRIESMEDAVRFHYCESLFLAKSLPPGPLRIADVGSGGGFPRNSGGHLPS